MSRSIVQTRSISRHYGDSVALHMLDLSIQPGEFVSLFGPNGAGKTTLLKLICGLLPPTSGKVLIDGVETKHARARRCIGLVSHRSLVYDRLTGVENLLFAARMYDVPDAEKRARTLLEELGLRRAAGEPVSTYSRGMQQRLSIARALIHDPTLLLLDEPFTGLDIHARELLTTLLRRFNDERRTVIMSTHDVDHGLAMANRVLLLVRGRLVYDQHADLLPADAFTEVYNDLVSGGGKRVYSPQAGMGLAEAKEIAGRLK